MRLIAFFLIAVDSLLKILCNAYGKDDQTSLDSSWKDKAATVRKEMNNVREVNNLKSEVTDTGSFCTEKCTPRH
jgi:hypothetical protein